MNTSEQILVIILSVFLALFLLLGIVVAIQVVRLLRQLRRITDKAERIVESAESVGAVFRSAAGPISILKLVQTIVESVTQHKHSKKRGD